MGENAKTWQGLLQTVVEANRDIVSSKRLKGHLDTFAEKNPSLRGVVVSGDTVGLREGFPEDEGGLLTVATVIGVLYWILENFTGATSAAERIRRPVREYISRNLPPGSVMGLNRYLPTLHLEETGSSDGSPEAPARSAAPEPAGEAGEPPPERTEGARVAPAATGARLELWERSTGERTEGEAAVAGAPGGGSAIAELPGEAVAAQFKGTVPWLGESIPRGCSLLVEGPGEAKEDLALRFIGEGLRDGESVLVLVASTPEEFKRRMGALGFDTAPAEQAGRLRILDWATFRERHIGDIEDDGPVMRLPMELPHVNSAINLALADLPESGSPRAFVDILPRALATVAIETVFNFVQVNIFKFKRRSMTALFTMEEEKDPEKAAIRLSFNSWLEVSEAPGGKYSVRLGGPILRPKLKTLAYSDGGWTVEEEQALAPEREPAAGPSVPGELLARLSEWRSQGFDVSALEAARAADPARAASELDEFAGRVARLRTIRNDLRIMDLAGVEADAAAIQDMLHDVGRVEQAERAHRLLLQKLERRRAAAREGAAAARGAPGEGAAAFPTPAAGDGAELRAAAEARERERLGTEQEAVRRAQDQARLREEAERRSREAPAEEEKRREFREAVERWKLEGFAVGALEESLKLDLERARRDFLLFRVQLQRLRELGEELAAIDEPSLEGRKAALSAMLKDVSRIPDLERGLEALRADSAQMREQERTRREEERTRRAALSEKLFWWSSHGLAVDRLESALAGDISAAEREFGRFEPAAQRLVAIAMSLSSLDVSGFPREAAALEALLGDVGNLEGAEAAFAELSGLAARHSREAQERRALRDRLEALRARGFAVGAVEKALEGDLGGAQAALTGFEEEARAAETMLSQLGSLDLRGFEKEAERLRRALLDPSRNRESRQELGSLVAGVERARAEELEREEYRRRIGEWRKGGLQTAQLEALLNKDMAALRKAVTAFQFDVDLHDDLVGLLEPLAGTRYADEAGRLQRELRDFSRMPALEDEVAALRARAESEALAAGQEAARDLSTDLGLLRKVQGWVEGGLAVRRLEGALRHERDGWRAEMDRLEKDIEELSREGSALEVLDTKGHEADKEHIRSLLGDPDNLPLVRAYRDSLRAKIARRKKEGERKASLAAVAADWERRGHRIKELRAFLESDLDRASSEFVLFRTRMAAAEHLRRRLDALELSGADGEVERLRRRLNETDDPAALVPEVEALWKASEERGRERGLRRKAARERKRILRERILGWLERGFSVRRLERALELPPDEADREIARFEEDLRRLQALADRVATFDAPGFEPELEALRRILNDVDRIPDVDRRLEELAARAESARLEDEARKEAERARRAEEERRLALRRSLEERLREWGGLGLNVEGLSAALAGDLALAEKRFAEFEGALLRCEELRGELHALFGRVPEGVPGAETVERMLQDPLKLSQAERALAEYRKRAQAAMAARDAELERFRARIRELGAAGEDVGPLESAAGKGLSEVRQAFAEFERGRKRRALEDTWMAVKSKVLSGPPPGPRPGAEGPEQPTAAGPEGGRAGAGGAAAGALHAPAGAREEEEAAPGRVARRKVKRIRK